MSWSDQLFMCSRDGYFGSLPELRCSDENKHQNNPRAYIVKMFTYRRNARFFLCQGSKKYIEDYISLTINTNSKT